MGGCRGRLGKIGTPALQWRHRGRFKVCVTRATGGLLGAHVWLQQAHACVVFAGVGVMPRLAFLASVECGWLLVAQACLAVCRCDACKMVLQGRSRSARCGILGGELGMVQQAVCSGYFPV